MVIGELSKKRIEGLSERNQADGNSATLVALVAVVLVAVVEGAIPGVGGVIGLAGPVQARR
jgi:hypothetical protein